MRAAAPSAPADTKAPRRDLRRERGASEIQESLDYFFAGAAAGAFGAEARVSSMLSNTAS